MIQLGGYIFIPYINYYYYYYFAIQLHYEIAALLTNIDQLPLWVNYHDVCSIKV